MRNVVLLILDSVRKDVFDEVAKRLRARADVEYKQCRAASTWSVPSHASLFTGKLPHEHGIHTYSRHYTDVGTKDTFLNRLPNHRTIGVSANVFASEEFGFDALFDHFVNISQKRRFPEGIDVTRFGLECQHDGLRKQLAFLQASLEHDYPLRSMANGAHVFIDDVTKKLPVPKPFDDGGKSIARTAERLVSEEGGEEPFFLFANFMDAHGPLTPTRGYDTSFFNLPYNWTSDGVNWDSVIERGEYRELDNYLALYRAAVEYLDRRVTSLIETVQEETSLPTTFVVTADHGENLGSEADDSLFGHSDSSLTEGLLHVPAIVINAPDETGVPTDEYVSHTDFGDLLVGFGNGTHRDISRDRIAAERFGNDRPELIDDPMVRCVYSGEVKYYWDTTGVTQRYRLDAGTPSWQEPADGPVAVVDLEAELFTKDISTAYEMARRKRDDVDVDEATAQKLQDLGYM